MATPDAAKSTEAMAPSKGANGKDGQTARDAKAAFDNWFGRSMVTVTGEPGDPPQVMYHGSSRVFEAFDRMASTQWRQPSMDTVGSWFTNVPARAEAYAPTDKAVIYPVYLAITRPKVYDTFRDFLVEMHEAEGRDIKDQPAPGLGSTEGLRTRLKAQGYDGIAFTPTAVGELHNEIEETRAAVQRARQEEYAAPRTERAVYTARRQRLEGTLARLSAELEAFGGSTEFDGHQVWVAFEPGQIKSAIGNDGQFDREQPSILHQAARGAQAAASTTDTPSAHPVWFASGAAVDSDMEALEAASQDAPYILEDEDLDLEWRIAEVPISEIDASEVAPEPERLEERLSLIRQAASLERPIFELLPSGRLKILDGWHRLQVAKERGQTTLSALVGTSTAQKNQDRESSRAQAFDDWFDGSQIVNKATGEPLVVYHGTSRNFDAFDRKAPSTHIPLPGFFFTPDPAVASHFAETSAKLDANRAGAGSASRAPAANVMPVHLAIRNPAVIDASDAAHGGRMPGEKVIAHALRQAMKAGHDGAIIRGWSDGSGPVQYVAFKPEQIKSALGNRGTFDRLDPNILHRSAADSAQPVQPSSAEIDDGLATTVSPRSLEALAKGDLAAALQAIEQDSTQPVHRALAARLGPLLDGVTQVSLCPQLRTDDGAKSYGCATSDGSRVWLSLEDGRIAEETVLHECVHAGVQHMLQRPLDSLTPIQRDARALLDQVWATARKDAHVSPAMSPAAQAQLGEFVAEALTHADLRERLQQRPWKLSTMSTMWRGLKDGLLGMVGMPPRQTMLVAAMAAIDTLMERPSTGAVPRTQDNPAFKGWIGRTKVVDERTGQPRVVYHGTNKSFDRFDPFMQGTNVRGNPTTRMGFFFTQQPGGAQRWAQRSNPVGANIMPVYLAIEKPREISAKRFAYLLKSARAQTIDRLVEESQARGFDGLKITYEPAQDRGAEGEPETWWVAFKPQQIKSAIGNRGTFDPEDQSILHRMQADRKAQRAQASDITQTETFRRWADGTQVVDSAGKPLVVYHGTLSDEDFAAFDTNQYEGGTFFSTDPRVASHFADPERTGNDPEDYRPRVIPVYLSIRNPKVLQAEDVMERYKDGKRDPSGVLTHSFDAMRRAMKLAQQQGYDGARIVGATEAGEIAADQWVAFKPEQIKSAIGNRGTFDRGEPDILHLAAWHGTPHRGIERFSTEKIGTGEGAQAYGWGLYFTSRQEIGEWYRKRLTQALSSEKWFRTDGESIETPTDVIHEIAYDMTWKFPDENLSAHEAASFVEHAMSMLRERALSQDDALQAAGDDAKLRAAVKILYEGYTVQYEPPPEGEVYEVEIPDEEGMLLWDRPLSEQSAPVRQALQGAGIVVDGKYGEGYGATPMFPGAMTFSGEAIYKRIVERQFGLKTAVTSAARKASEQEASEFLLGLGIRGIKYLDGNSRAGGEGTYNYVVFDGDDVEVVRAKYGSVDMAQQCDLDERARRAQAPRG